jgi:hypothetical protein
MIGIDIINFSFLKTFLVANALFMGQVSSNFHYNIVSYSQCCVCDWDRRHQIVIIKLHFMVNGVGMIKTDVFIFNTNVFLTNFKLLVPCIFSTYEMKNQKMSLFQFYSYD